MPRCQPHDLCAACERTLSETGGVRLVATGLLSVRVCTPGEPLGNVLHPARTLRLSGDFRDTILVFSGDYFWTDEIVHRVERIVYEGRRPWVCQRCLGNSICPHCDSPLTTTPGTDRLDDDGKVVHVPHVAGYLRKCSNPECEAHRVGVRDDDVSERVADIPYDPALIRGVREMLGDDETE